MKSQKRRKKVPESNLEELIDIYRENKRLYELFNQQVLGAFLSCPKLNTGIPPIIHSAKSRLKDERHLAKKIIRKRKEGRVITAENLLVEITDLSGIRILHLHQDQFSAIFDFISGEIKSKNWRLLEKPIAYTWDPESVEYFKKFRIRTSVKPSYYTSVHFIIAPGNKNNDACCEVQVRTLFEEVWGEIDHSINYPDKSEKIAVIEQLRVLSKLVSTGSRLADAIFKTQKT